MSNKELIKAILNSNFYKKYNPNPNMNVLSVMSKIDRKDFLPLDEIVNICSVDPRPIRIIQHALRE